MERRELRAAVVEVLVRVLKVPADIDPAANLLDHGLTSLESISLVFALEERFALALPDEALLLDNFTTAEKITDLVALTANTEA